MRNIFIAVIVLGVFVACGRDYISRQTPVPSGVIEGEVICQSSDIEGTVIGKINCQDLLSLKATAKLNGDIITKKLAIEPGAVFTGNCSMGGGVVKEMDPMRLTTANSVTRPETAQVR